MNTTCKSIKRTKKVTGVMQGTDTWTEFTGVCGKATIDGAEYCPFHQAKAAKLQEALVAKRAKDARTKARKESLMT